MKITLSKFAGFCGGVKRAYEMIIDLDLDQVKKPIYVLGSLVHNEDVVKKIEEKGIKKIDYKDFLEFNKNIGTLIITAHGVGPKIYELAKEKNIDVIDTTCPKVTYVQKLSQKHSADGVEVIVIGDKDHKEVKGIFEWGDKKAKIISSEDEINNLKIDSDKKVIVISQTTQDQELFKKISQKILDSYPEVEIINTICLTTENRQSEIRQLAKGNDLMLIIGSPASANSTRLYEISKEINSRSYFIENVSQIKKDWFKKIKSIGVSAGASTPTWVIEEVTNYLSDIK